MKTAHVLLAALTPLVLTGSLSLSSGSRPTPDDRRLAERAESAVKLAWGTPANEIANMITYDDQHDLIPLLKGEIKGDPERLNFARSQIAAVSAVCEDGPSWPRPPRFIVPRAPSAPTIDGRIDEPGYVRG